MKKSIVALMCIFIILVLIIIILMLSIKNKSTFKMPEFDKNVSSQIPIDIDYQSSIIKVSDGYSVYIDGVPYIEKNDLVINFISIENNNVWIKIRIIDEEKNIIAESGLVKPGEYLKSVKLLKKISVKTNVTYMIMGYEIGSYMSAGTVNLNTKVGV